MGALVCLLPAIKANPALIPLVIPYLNNPLALLAIPASSIAGRGLAIALRSAATQTGHRQNMTALQQQRLQSDEDFRRKKPLLTKQQARLKEELKISQRIVSAPALPALADNPYLLIAGSTESRKKRDLKDKVEPRQKTNRKGSDAEDETTISLPNSSSLPNLYRQNI